MSERMKGVFEEEGAAEVVETVEAEKPEPIELQEPEEAPAEAAAEPEGENEGAPPAPSEDEPKSVPVNALQDERKKRQAAEAEAKAATEKVAAFEQKMAELEKRLNTPPQQPQMQQPRQEPPKKPDFFTDPEARLAMELQSLYQAIQRERMQDYQDRETIRLNNDELWAKSRHGEQLVEEAFEAFQRARQSDPVGSNLIAERIARSRSPYEELVTWHKEAQLLTEVSADPDAYRERIRQEAIEAYKAELAAQAEQQPAQPETSPRPKIPGSLAKAPAAGGQQPVAVNAPARMQGIFG